jgi:hypothetical protein
MKPLRAAMAAAMTPQTWPRYVTEAGTFVEQIHHDCSDAW